MNEKKIKELAIRLAQAESEVEVISILKKWGYWDDPSAWRYYGDNENNFSIIGNQQSAPDSALVEKIINSVDAVLMRECLRRGIDPESDEAPPTIEYALEEFFNVRHGMLTSISPRKRRELAENIMLVATGKKSKESYPNYIIIDKGEGQTPLKMPQTFLSLAKSNKLRIPFVQGKFNMGGTGALQFCGKHNLQLIISRRDPKIVDVEGDDGTSEYWGFTIIRRFDPEKGMKSSTFKYLAPGGNVLMFKAKSLPLLPGDFPIPYEKPLEWGTFIKLYEYQLVGLKTAVYFDLYYRLAVLLPNIALPVLLVERRKPYTAQGYDVVLSGLSVRLEENKYKHIEEGFPSSASIKIRGQEMKIQIFVFKRETNVKHYKTRKEGIIFTVNGQAHGFIPDTFFSRKSVGMAYLANSLLVIADCSNFDGRTREDLFMNSRDRLREGELKKEIEKEIGELIKKHQGLRELKEKRRREEIQGKIGDAKPLIRVIEKVIKNSPTLSQLFGQGVKIKNPFNFTSKGVGTKFKGKKYPTYFRLVKDFPYNKPKHCPINQRFRVQFETDAENNYFKRDLAPGEFTLMERGNKVVTSYVLNLWNGIANLTVTLPPDAKVGEIIEYVVEVRDIHNINPFLVRFYVMVDPPVSKSSGKPGERIKPPGGSGNYRKTPSSLDLPNIIEVKKDEWEKYGFNKESALKVMDSGENGYDFYINMDNVYLLTEIKGRINEDVEILKAQYKYGMVLIGLALLKEYEKNKNNENENIYEKISEITKAISPVLLPMISTLSELEGG